MRSSNVFFVTGGELESLLPCLDGRCTRSCGEEAQSLQAAANKWKTFFWKISAVITGLKIVDCSLSEFENKKLS